MDVEEYLRPFGQVTADILRKAYEKAVLYGQDTYFPKRMPKKAVEVWAFLKTIALEIHDTNRRKSSKIVANRRKSSKIVANRRKSSQIVENRRPNPHFSTKKQKKTKKKAPPTP